MSITKKTVRASRPERKLDIRTKEQAQLVADEARKILKRRQKEFIEKLKKCTFVDINPKKHIQTIKIRLPETGVVAELDFIIEKKESQIFIAKITVGEFSAENDSLRGFGIGTYLLNIVKRIAKKRKIPKLVLLCEGSQVTYYKRLGFVISERETHTKYYEMICFV